MDPITTTAAAAGAVVTVGTAAGLVLAGTRWVGARWRPVAEFLEDWRGEAGRPGVPGRAGVMERLESLEQGNAMIAEHLTWHRNQGVVDPTARVVLARNGRPVERRPVQP